MTKFNKTYKDSDGKWRNTKEGQLWFNMNIRCYNEKHLITNPSYRGCYMSENFKDFQFFARWCQDKIGFNLQNYQLDKDLLVFGNKEYGEEFCVFIPRQINTFLNDCKRAQGAFPTGVYFNQQHEKFHVRVRTPDNGQRHVGYYDNVEEAVESYKKAKKEVAIKLANMLECSNTELPVDTRVINALYNWNRG